MKALMFLLIIILFVFSVFAFVLSAGIAAAVFFTGFCLACGQVYQKGD